MKILMVGLGGIGQRHMRNLKNKFKDNLEILAYRTQGNKEIITNTLEVKQGRYLIEGITRLIKEHGLEDKLSIIGYPFKSVFQFSGDKNFKPLEFKTFFQQECAKRGVLFIGYHLVSLAHTKKHIDYTLDVYDEVMRLAKENISNRTLVDALEGTVVTQIWKNVGDRSIENDN